MLYQSNITEVVKRINLSMLPLKFIAPLQKEVATSIRATIARRVFNDGQAVNGPIGRYSTTPVYVNPKKSPKKFATKGKKANSKSTFDNGKPRQTRYFGDGWKGFRSLIGRDVSKVNLQLSGRLKNSWAVGLSGSDWVIGFNSQYGSAVAAGNEERFGKQIFQMSRLEFNEAGKIIGKYIKKARNPNA